MTDNNGPDMPEAVAPATPDEEEDYPIYEVRNYRKGSMRIEVDVFPGSDAPVMFRALGNITVMQPIPGAPPGKGVPVSKFQRALIDKAHTLDEAFEHWQSSMKARAIAVQEEMNRNFEEQTGPGGVQTYKNVPPVHRRKNRPRF